MTSTLLPVVATSPFGKHFDRDLCDLSGATSFYRVSANGSSSSLLIHYRPQTVSPASALSIASSPLTYDDENSAPVVLRAQPQTPLTTCSSPPSTTDRVRKRHDEPVFRFAASPRPKQRFRSFKDEIKDGRSKESLLHPGRASLTPRTLIPEPNLNNNVSDPSIEHETPQRQPLDYQNSGTNDISLLEPFPTLNFARPSTPQTLEHEIQSDELQAPPSKMRKRTELSPFNYVSRRRHHRWSETSSVFVHSLKTVSTSNGSFSIMHKSLGASRSSDSHMHSGGLLRFSVDSERPLTTTSIDEAALSRGNKRRQIFQELVDTENSYVADLKALVYLYSTLLASTTSISSSTRVAIQRNVIGLLQLHEALNARLHQVVFKAAARKWADTVTPSRLRDLRNARWRSHEGHRARTTRMNRQIRNSLESEEALRSQADLEATDPTDIMDIATIFQETLTSFFAYEEYCANHEIIAHELQKRTPMLWSTYEAGMESLGRSLAAIDQKADQDKKGLTVGDLLIKPIQRICRYPLILEDLLRCTPVVDSPGTHSALEAALQRLREVVLAVNMATDNPRVRAQIQHRWSIQDRLNLNHVGMSADQFRELGRIHLCGVLYITYETAAQVDGCYAFCILFDTHFLIAIPGQAPGQFDLLCLINLADLKVLSGENGSGMQCQSALHTWKICFGAQGHFREILLSACSSVEEGQWLQGLQGAYEPAEQLSSTPTRLATRVYLDLRSVGVVFGPNVPLSRRSSIQRAATVCNRASSCQVILRNTHNPQDLQEYRNALPSRINRSRSHATTDKIVVLAPKRSERSRLETMLSDVWTKDKIPFPGMIASKSSQILRASAGSLVRKLSLASIHAPFARRSESLTVSSQKSHETLPDRRRGTPAFQIRKDSIEDSPPMRTNRPKGWSELDSMDSVVGRMIGGSTSGSKRLSFSSGDKLRRRSIKKSKPGRSSIGQVGLEDPAAVFYGDDGLKVQTEQAMIDSEGYGKASHVEQGLRGDGKRKRWSNPMAMLRGIGSDGLRNMLHSSK